MTDLQSENMHKMIVLLMEKQILLLTLFPLILLQ